MLRHWEKLLELFPFSKLSKRGPVLRVYVLEHSEPPLFEREFPPVTTVADICAAAADFVNSDVSIELDAAWDLWQHDQEWRLMPAPVTLIVSGFDFDSGLVEEENDHLRIEFGVDSRFLPQEGLEGSARMAQSNLRSLLHLVGQVESGIPLERRQLWSESGVNFADLLADSVRKLEVN